MDRRHKTQKGQALVMISVALLAMCGVMGLAVDLGWSFFVKKQAQAAADAAAMGAVQEAMNRLGGSPSTFLCGTPGAMTPYCSAQVDCSSFSATDPSNLNNGCLYAKQNGFVSGANSRKVTMQADDRNNLPTTPDGQPLGVNNVVYWVTVRTLQTVPQLFSAVLGNTQGTVSAIATAGIVSVVVPGQVYTLDDQPIPMGSTGNRGVNVDLGDTSSITLSGPAFLSSTCTTASGIGCDGPAGQTNPPASLTAGSIETRVANATSGIFNPTPVIGAGRDFRDPTEGEAQPPIVANTPVRTCGLQDGAIRSASGPVVVGPFNYYAYDRLINGSPHVVQRPITLQGDVHFSPASTNCPGILSFTGSVQSSAFPSYFFYGGLQSNTNTDITFGAGQYVMVGALPNNSTGSANPVFRLSSGTVTGDSSVGTMFIFTAQGYPGVDTQINAFSELGTATAGAKQGFVDIRSGANVSLTGISAGSANLPPELKQYSGIAFWQDRQNSFGNDAITNSTRLRMGPNGAGSTTVNINGAIYQPKGAYIDARGNLTVSGATQIITGGIRGRNSAHFNLSSVTNPLIQYVNALIQ